jgi:hypothetical protein
VLKHNLIAYFYECKINKFENGATSEPLFENDSAKRNVDSICRTTIAGLKLIHAEKYIPHWNETESA